jgi:uncharacterized membrane protein HdeD (DUF308 family)
MSETNSTLPRQHVAEVIGTLWWLVLLRGVVLLILGGYLLFRPATSMDILTKVLGIYLVAEGVIALLVALLGKTPSRGWTAVRGVLVILAGIFVFAHSTVVAEVAAELVLYLIAFVAILSGILDIVAAIQDRKEMEGEGWLILSGVLTILFGVLLAMAPLTFGLVLVRILGAFAILSGISFIVLAFRMRGVGKALRQ